MKGVEVLAVGGGQIWVERTGDKRSRTEATQEENKRRRLNDEDEVLPVYATRFSKEEIEADGKKPKKKVAVMLGYSGSGYKGMQLNHHEKTIEGDLFSAFVAAGAVSKANADDPKKSSLVRCARTDRGVHAAGNVISLKMIIEDPAIVKKINEKLSPQIRVWGIERTNGSFSAYQLCDSRVYEYMIPTYCFLPPHPESFLGKELPQVAEEANDLPGYEERQKEISSFWNETEEKHVKPFLDSLDPDLSASIRKILSDNEPRLIEVESDVGPNDTTDIDRSEVRSPDTKTQLAVGLPDSGNVGEHPGTNPDDKPSSSLKTDEFLHRDLSIPNTGIAPAGDEPETKTEVPKGTDPSPRVTALDPGTKSAQEPLGAAETSQETKLRPPLSPLEAAIKKLKSIIVTAKKAYRIDPKRLDRVQSVLNHYVGTHNFHNYTISKHPRDPSAKRVIKSFNVGPKPIIINDTEWLSLKVHGQSFMMHQIRKMITMAALVVRCGCPEERMDESYGHDRLSLPKAPSLGLLLERPVFDTYNNKKRVEDVEGKGEVGFDKYQNEIEEFKQREIYQRIFREEEARDTFHSFFASLDTVKKPDLLYVSSLGIPAIKRPMDESEKDGKSVEQIVPEVSEDEEGEDANGQDG
ncbi:MAG: hypothetical protein Q9182_005537 [Xanthomendoza sp. 2 TL-2023]